MQISSLMDTWLLLYNRESNGEHNRQLYVLKSRGMAHSNQLREFLLSSEELNCVRRTLALKACSQARPGSRKKQRRKRHNCFANRRYPDALVKRIAGVGDFDTNRGAAGAA